jgi:regulator of RNase E activity RraA
MALDQTTLEKLSEISTATISTVLLKKGLRNVWMRGTRPLRTNQPRVAGHAFTLRFIPVREDVATPESWSSPHSTRAAIEVMPAGYIAVADTMGVNSSAIFGDILCARMKQRGVTALVTDGVIRDVRGVLDTNFPVWSQGVAAPPSITGLTFVGWQEPIACGGVAVYPEDIVVADDDGSVVIPNALLDEVVSAACDQEQMESWIMSEVVRGEALLGLYPPNTETQARYKEAVRKGFPPPKRPKQS